MQLFLAGQSRALEYQRETISEVMLNPLALKFFLVFCFSVTEIIKIVFLKCQFFTLLYFFKVT